MSARPDPPGLPRPVAVAVIERDWHTEIGLDAGDATGPLAFLRARFPGTRGFTLGFGDRHYLAVADPGFLDMLAAIFPAPGALLVTGLSAPPEAAFGPENVTTLHLTRPGALRLVTFLAASFEHAPGAAPEPLRRGPYLGSLYYTSPVIYALTHTCNTWTAEALQESGTPVAADGVIVASQVMRRARAAASP